MSDPTPQDPTPEAPPSDGHGAGASPEQRTFTQVELDALFADRANRAANRAQAELLAALGVENIDAAKKLMAEADKARKAQMSEAEAALAELTDLKTKMTRLEQEKAQALATANERMMLAAVQLEAAKADYRFRPEALGDVWAFIDRSQITVDEAGTVQGVAEAVKAVAEAKPYMVVAEETPPAPLGTPSRRPQRQAPAQQQPPNGTEQTVPTIRF